MARRVCVIGLDSAPPELVFDRFLSDLPNLRSLMERGVWGPLESTVPPITVPAWMSMFTGRDPGALGIYGFRNRRDHSYDGLAFASSRMVHEQAVWDVLGAAGMRSILLGIPLTYPPRPIQGLMVCDFLAPSTSVQYTYPASLADDIRRVVGEYVIDVRDFRTTDKDRLLAQVHEMTDVRFALARHLAVSEPWDLFAMVEMGPDRLHHGFWRYFDAGHPLHEPGNPYQHALRDYYRRLDEQVGSLLAVLPDDTTVMVVSDHGARRMVGGICVNDWLIREGYLSLKRAPDRVTKLAPDMVDWPRTRAWGDGGYYGRIFLNVKGREQQGAVDPDAYEALRDELSSRLRALPDERGRPIGTRTFRPQEVYAECRGIPPDLIVYFGDLDWRSVGSVGHDAVWTHENDTGPDDANHSPLGIAIVARPGQTPGSTPLASRRRDGWSICRVAPAILQELGVEPPTSMGRDGLDDAEPSSVYSEDEEAEIARRLEDLGYL
ncbi:MAG TPA: alkaline phosphatase family protein [Chthonomonadales bacterium]|nr:alkaline phosphatase family protein [Chthonomonadales bacterium]